MKSILLQGFILIQVFVFLLSVNSCSIAEKDKHETEHYDYSTISIKGKQVYLNGINVPLVYWQNDLGQFFDPEKIETVFSEIEAAGGNSVRWWLFYNMNYMEFNGEGMFVPLAQDVIDDFGTLLDLAQKHNIIVNPCFFSFEMPWFDEVNRDYFFNTDEGIDNVIASIIAPLVSAHQSHPALGIWEIINEPEWAVERAEINISLYDMQRFCGKITAAIHGINQDAMVTVGNAYVRSLYNGDYSDESLTEAAGDNLAALDLYQAHYYEWMKNVEVEYGILYDPWNVLNSESFDKPLIIGEFPNDGDKYYTADEMYINSVLKGYVGAWGWMYFDSDPNRQWPAGKSGIEAVAKMTGTK